MAERPIDRALKKAKELGMNQSQFAAALKPEVDPQTITNWKRRGMPPDQHERVADALGCSVDELLGRVPHRKKQPPEMIGAAHQHDKDLSELIRLWSELDPPRRARVLDDVRDRHAAQGKSPVFSPAAGAAAAVKLSVRKPAGRAVRRSDSG